MNKFIYLAFILNISCAADKRDQEEHPIDLSVWRLTLPVDQDGDMKPDTYGPGEMEEALQSGKLKPYFYKADDGALVFYCEQSPDLATTPNSKYPRTELREHLVPGDFHTNWTLEQGGRMSARIKVTKATAGDRFMIMQIHGRLTKEQRSLIGKRDYDAPPLLKIYYNDGRLEVAYKVLKDSNLAGDSLLVKANWRDAKHFYFDQPLGQESFDLEIMANAGWLEVRLNDARKRFEHPDLNTWPFENYFKAGNYLTSKDDSAYSEVKFYSLKTAH